MAATDRACSARRQHCFTIPEEIEGLLASCAAVEHSCAASSREEGAELAWKREVEEVRFRIIMFVHR